MSATPAPITPNAETFAQLFTKRFEVPRYQRTYDWDDEQVGDVLGDLLRVHEGGADVWHFFGALVTIVIPAPATVPKVYFEVVDGQQRLATLLIVVAELRRALEAAAAAAQSDGDTAAAGVATAAVHDLATLLSEHGLARLVLSRRDRQYFEEVVAGTAATPPKDADEAHAKLHKAQQKIVAELIEVVREGAGTPAQRVGQLLRFKQTVLTRCYVVHLETPDRREAYRLFATLNDRGRKLSVGALLRTHTLSLLEGYDTQMDTAEEAWDDLLREGQNWADAFLGGFFASYSGRRVTSAELFDAFLVQFAAELPAAPAADAAQANAIREFAIRLRTEGAFFQRLQGGQWPFSGGSASDWDRDRLARLVKILGHTLSFPLLLAVGRECGEARFAKLVLTLERFVFRYITISRASADALAKSAYYPVAKLARETQRFESNTLENELKRLRDDYANDEVFATNLKERMKYRDGAPAQNRLLKHFLTTLEDHYAWWAGGANGRPRATKHSVFDFAQTNLEHIHPRNPEAADRVVALDAIVHDLGNMTLLDEDDGRVASNDVFAEKQSIYASSKIALSRELGEVDEWTPTQVDERAEWYAQMALKIFVV